MSKKVIFGLLLVSLLGCLGRDVNVLEFFEVKLPGVEASVELGLIELNGLLEKAIDIQIEEHGFVWAPTVEALENRTEEARWIRLPGAPANVQFDTTVSGFELDRTYYFQAYAEGEGRRAFSAIRSFSLGINLKISRAVYIDNDTAVISASVSGLQQTGINISVSEYGFVLSDSEVFPEYQVNLTTFDNTLNDDGPFEEILTGLDFNKRYYARAYLKPEGLPPFYSDTLSFRMADGWKNGKELSNGLFNASSADLGGKGYVVFGCLEESCVSRSTQLLIYDPEQGEWGTGPPFEGGAVQDRYGAVAFAIGDTLYAGFGVAPTPNGSSTNIQRQISWIAPNGSNTWTELNPERRPPNDVGRRQGAVAFVLKGKAYIGTGKDNDGQALNDFWQFDPDTPPYWKQMPSLPRRTPTATEDKGRFNAVAFTIEDKGYVGSGADIARAFQDFWEFTPPGTSDTSGHWQWHSMCPGSPRFDATAFAIGKKGYFGGGQVFDNSLYLEDFWEFDPSKSGADAWKEASRFRGKGRARAFGFAVNGKGYVGGGTAYVLEENNFFDLKILSDLWIYTPLQLQ